MLQDELTTIAAQQQQLFDASTSPDERKVRGHFGTSPGIAQFMAGLFSRLPDTAVRFLDPGAGVGTLSAAICQRLLPDPIPRTLHFELWENDPTLIPLLQRTMSGCQKAFLSLGHEISFDIRNDDFVLANTERTLFSTGPDATFHIAILNPPYFKLRKDSSHARAMSHVVHGQPNIYALFMAVTADLLAPNGEMVAITPRSYFNGSYFRRFRKWFFDRMTVRQIHLFESRTEAFRNDSVLQENVILHAEKNGAMADVKLSTSTGRDLIDVRTRTVSYDRTIDNSNGDHVVRVTTNALEHEIVEALDAMLDRFRDLGFVISTGPVVTFRATELLREKKNKDTAPLLWMHNVRPFITQFPVQKRKPTHILVSKASGKLLVPAKTYVLLKRFTSKEEKRRLVAGIVTAQDSYSEWLGLENHLNYVYRTDGDFSNTHAFGLAAYFNSAMVDRYFRAISGNTQVNATEIRRMPVPNETLLARIGQRVQSLETLDSHEVDRIVGDALRLPPQLVEKLLETS
ncbi:MAG: Eco57I restriction-modification methylase domain-containing protein [Planctomycetaceae bacterium]